MPTVSQFLIERLTSSGVKAIFGVPGDYILGTYKKIEDCPDIELVGVTDEAHAGFAADAYARMNGIGCVLVTYNVGSLKCMNPVAGAYAERSPVIVIVGSPGIKERSAGLLLHHTVRDFDTQREIFANITCANTVLDDPHTAAYEIDRVLVALKTHRQPIYIEIPRDIADKQVGYDLDQGTPKLPTSDQINLRESLDEVLDWIASAKDPVILAGVELSRFGLGNELVKWAERTNIPIFTELLSKSTVGEMHPLFGGVYSGNSAVAQIKDMVDQSDCILMLGVLLTDLILGGAKPDFISRQTVRANVGSLKVRNHGYSDIVFSEFCSALFRSDPGKRSSPAIYKKSPANKFVVSAGDPKITTGRFFEKIDSIITSKTVIISDVGDSLFGSSDLTITHANSFIGPAYYTSMGMAIPGSLGVCLAKPEMRPIVIVGDGAFQMSLSEISTLVRRRLNPIIFVLNNRGYTTERFLLDGKFNDIADWEYHKVVDLFGGGSGYRVSTESDLESAVTSAIGNAEVSVINVIVGPRDITPALGRAIAGLRNHI